MSVTLPGDAQLDEPMTRLALHLQRLGLASFAASLLEAGAPLTPVLAQGIYMSQPLMEPWLPPDRLDALAALLEDENQTAALVHALRVPPE